MEEEIGALKNSQFIKRKALIATRHDSSRNLCLANPFMKDEN